MHSGILSIERGLFFLAQQAVKPCQQPVFHVVYELTFGFL